MARPAVAHEAVFALRREIARIEGILPERLEMPEGQEAAGRDSALLPTGVKRLDAALGGGLPQAALTEIHGRQSRDAGIAAGFALALASQALQRAETAAPLLWIAMDEAFSEAGVPYAPGLGHRFSIPPGRLLFASARRLDDALWIAEEAAALTALSAVLLEVRSPAAGLDLTATRRLHHRTRAAGRPLFLLRQAGQPEPTAAPVRLVVSPAPAGERRTLAGPLAGSIGSPAFTVTVSRSRTSIPATLTLEWNRDEHSLCERQHTSRRPQDTGAVAALSAGRAYPAQPAGAVMALRRRA